MDQKAELFRAEELNKQFSDAIEDIWESRKYTKLYFELLNAVSQKIQGQTRHETALKPIQNAQLSSNQGTERTK